MKTTHNEEINKLVSSKLAKLVTFKVTYNELCVEYQRLHPDGHYNFNKKNLSQSIIRRKIRAKYPKYCEVRFSPSQASSSLWFDGENVTILIKRKYKIHLAFPKPVRIF